jgi:predicted Zn finger-like uncharacterized protein
MILECPSCHAQFNVPDNALGAAGRTVRCAKCQHQWHAMPSTEAPEPLAPPPAPITVPPVTYEPPAPSTEPQEPKARFTTLEKTAEAFPEMDFEPRISKVEPKLSTGMIFSGIMALLIAIIATLIVKHPATLGYPRSKNFVLADLALASQNTDKGMEYAVKGRIVHNGKEAEQIPTLRITLVNQQGEPLRFWDIHDEEKYLGANEDFTFNAGPLKTNLVTGNRFVVELGNPLELALRRKP